jgi:hypothetical protein
VKDRARGRCGCLGASSLAGSADPHPCLEGGSGVATQCGHDAEVIRFTLISFYFSTYILIKPST